MTWVQLSDDVNRKYRGATQELLGIAYAHVMSDRLTNYQVWYEAQRTIRQGFDAWLDAHGQMPPLQRAYWRNMLAPGMPQPDPAAHAALVQAFFTDASDIVAEHIRYRLDTEGNFHASFSGTTGMGKSSCAISIADWIKPIHPEKLTQHLARDPAQLPFKIKGKERGDTVIQDEYTNGYGEGARTMQDYFENLEDTLRKSGINLLRLCPRRIESETMQCDFQVVAWNPEEKHSLFLAWVADMPVGMVGIQWCRKELYAAYEPWKDEGIEATKAGVFKDHAATARRVLQYCEDERFVRFLVEPKIKPRKKDIEDAMEFIPSVMATTRQRSMDADLLYRVATGWERFKNGAFEELFGLQVNAGLAAIGTKISG